MVEARTQVKDSIQDAVRTQLSGTVERVVFHNTDNGWSVLKVKVKGRKKFATVVGFCAFVTPGEGIDADGEWTDHPEFGERFMASAIRTTLPRQANAAEKYLASGMVKGVGPELAKRMVARFGANVFDIIEQAPDLLQDVSGIGPTRVSSICEAWSEQRALRGLMEFLGTHGISVSKAPRILRALGYEAVSILEKNPYRLARDVEGVGFKSADVIARHLKLALDSEERFASAIHDRLLSHVSKGHCAYPADLLLKETAAILSDSMASAPNAKKMQEALDSEIEAGRLDEQELSKDGRTQVCVFPAGLAAAERRLAENLLRLNSERPRWVSALPQLRRENPLYPVDSPPRRSGAAIGGSALPAPFGKSPDLSISQREALSRILNSKVSLLTGGPGTGKTTLMRSVRMAINAQGFKVIACAPTGRAAQRLSEASGLDAQTIHRLLGWDPEIHGFRFNSENPLRVDFLIVDESSMIGLELMDALIAALPTSAGLLLVGDTDQLPSIQAGRVLDSLIEAHRQGKLFTRVHLTEVFRQVRRSGVASAADGSATADGSSTAEDVQEFQSGILKAASNVLKGEMPSFEKQGVDSDFHFIEIRDPVKARETIVQLVRDRIPARFKLDPFEEVQVISPLHRGEAGARALNKALQEALNPLPPDEIERFGIRYAVGDKVIVTQNDYDKDVFNGDIGKIIQVERDRSSLRIAFGTRRVDFDFTELDSIQPAFAITIHKSQGSEYEAVVIPLLEESAPLLSRNLLYTALTRAKKLAVIVGSRRSLQLAMRTDSSLDRRWTGLAERLIERAAQAAPADKTQTDR